MLKKGCGCIITFFCIMILLGSCFSDKEKDKFDKMTDWTTINLNTTNPSSQKFKDELQKLSVYPIKVEYSDTLHFVDIQFKVKADMKTVTRSELIDFAKCSARMLATFPKNKNIEKVSFTMLINDEDTYGNKSEIIAAYATYSKAIISKINFKNWINTIDNENTVNFFKTTDDFDIRIYLRERLMRNEQDYLY